MKVSDADRLAASQWHEGDEDAFEILVQAFARHRHEAIEMAAKVAETYSTDAVARAIRALAGDGSDDA